jgi:hypothetical protein
MSITAPELGGPAREEDVMHLLITQAIAADRARELHAHAAAARRARYLRRSRPGGRTWRFTRFPRRARAGFAASGPATAWPEGSLSPAPANR